MSILTKIQAGNVRIAPGFVDLHPYTATSYASIVQHRVHKMPTEASKVFPGALGLLFHTKLPYDINLQASDYPVTVYVWLPQQT